MLVLVTALECEARPLVRRLGLQRRHDRGCRIRTAVGPGVRLAIAGIGRTRAAAAAAALCATAAEPPRAAVNIGVCGAVCPDTFRIGELIAAATVIDSATGRRFVPGLPLPADIRRASLATFDQAVTAAAPPSTADLVDMEGAGFCDAARLFLPPSRIGCLKVVSDHLAPDSFGDDRFAALIEAQVEAIMACLSGS